MIRIKLEQFFLESDSTKRQEEEESHVHAGMASNGPGCQEIRYEDDILTITVWFSLGTPLRCHWNSKDLFGAGADLAVAEGRGEANVVLFVCNQDLMLRRR